MKRGTSMLLGAAILLAGIGTRATVIADAFLEALS
jgi:hypothetical protein